MKKILFAALMLAMLTPMYADPLDPSGEDVLRPRSDSEPSQWFLQVDLGANFNLLDGNNVLRPRVLGEGPNDLFESGNGLGLLFGLSVGHFFTNTFGLSFGAAYDVRSAGNSAATVDTCTLFGIDPITLEPFTILTPMSVDKEFNVRVDYLSLALLANLRFDKLLVNVGPTVSIPLSARLEESNVIRDSLCFYFFGQPDSTTSITGTNENTRDLNTRVSFKVALGYLIDITPRISLVPQVGFDLGLSDLYSTDQALSITGLATGTVTQTSAHYNHAVRINSIQAALGLRFNL